MSKIEIEAIDVNVCPRAYRAGQTDREFGMHLGQNPFMLPDNRHAWELGYKAAPRKRKVFRVSKVWL